MNNDKRWQGTTHPLQDLQNTRETKRMHKREERMGSVSRGKVKTHEETELDETLNIQQRQKRASIMRRYKSKIERGREVAKSRVAGQSNIKKRAYAQARQIFRKKLAGEHGAEYEKLGPSEKMAVDKLLDNKGKAIKKLALRLLPKVKKSEYERLQSYTKGHALMNKGVSEEFNELFLEYFGSSAPGNSGSTGERSMNPITAKDTKSKKTKAPQIKILGKFNEEYENDSPISRALENKADKAGIDLAIIGEVYDRGLEAWSEQYNVSPTQYAFARVNSFINKGKTYYNEDADLVEETIDELSKSTLKSYIDKTNDAKEFTGSLQKFMSRGKGYRSAKNKLKGTANVPATNEETELDEAGLWDNIHAKRKRIKAGSGERMRKPGSKGAPSAADLKAAQESVEIEELSTPTLHSYLDKAKKTTPFSKQRKPYGSDPVKHKEDERRREQRNSYMKTAVKKISAKYAAEETELDEAGSKYNIPMARSKPKTSTGRSFGSVLDEVDVPVKHLDRARSVWNRTKDVEAVKKFVSGVKEEVMKDKDPCWDGYEMFGKKKKGGKEVPNCVPVKEAKDPNRNSKLRQGMQYVERDITPETPDSDAVPPTSPCSDAAKQQRIKKRIIEQSDVEVDPAKRFIGTDSLVKVYKKATPGQSLDESFTMAFDYQGKPTLAPTASELHMQAKGGFAHHTDVQNVMEVTDIKNKIQAMFETTILEEDKDQLAISYNDLSDMVGEAFGIIEKIKTSTVERDAWSEAQILKMERYIESVNAYLDNMYEDVESGLKSPVVVPAHNDQYGNPIPAKTVLRKTGKKIIKSDQTK